MDDLPFRWNLEQRSTLGTLVDGPFQPLDPVFLDEVTRCCARIVAFSHNSDLFFVGRSPENFFDHLSGLLLDSTWAPRPHLLHFSLREDAQDVGTQAWNALRAYFTAVGLNPEQLASRERPVTFVDLVASGGTFGNIVQFLHRWSKDVNEDWNAVRRKIRLLGITIQQPTSPKTWRWQQHAEWVTLVEHQSIKNITIPLPLWDRLGNRQEKVTVSYTPTRWGSKEAAFPRTNLGSVEALKRALQLFDLGRSKECRQAFTRHLSQEKAMVHPWLRALIHELRIG